MPIRAESVEFRPPGDLAWSVGQLLLSQGHKAEWPSSTPDRLDVHYWVDDIDPDLEDVYAVVEAELGLLLGAAQVIHGSTVSLAPGRSRHRVPPYTYIVDHAAESVIGTGLGERALLAHIAQQAIVRGDVMVATSATDMSVVETLRQYGFTGDEAVLQAPADQVAAVCAGAQPLPD